MLCFAPSAAPMLLLHLGISCPGLTLGASLRSFRLPVLLSGLSFHPQIVSCSEAPRDGTPSASPGKSLPALPFPGALSPAASSWTGDGHLSGNFRKLPLTSLSLSGCVWMTGVGVILLCCRQLFNSSPGKRRASRINSSSSTKPSITLPFHHFPGVQVLLEMN